MLFPFIIMRDLLGVLLAAERRMAVEDFVHLVQSLAAGSLPVRSSHISSAFTHYTLTFTFGYILKYMI